MQFSILLQFNTQTSMVAPSVHHVGVGVLDEKPMLKLLQEQLCFNLICRRITNIDEKWVLQKGSITFALTKLKLQIKEDVVYAKGEPANSNNTGSSDNSTKAHCSSTSTQSCVSVQGSNISLASFPHFSSVWTHPSTSTNSSSESGKCTTTSQQQLITDEIGSYTPEVEPCGINDRLLDLASGLDNSVYDICLEVRDVQSVVDRASRIGASVIRPVTTIEDQYGSVTYATVRSCVGNVQHMLVNTSNYHGSFLPGFEDCNSINKVNSTGSDAVGQLIFDHVTLCVPSGQTIKSLKWYEECFGMHRLIVNREDSPVDGLMLNEIGMRMAAMEYWRCAESGLSLGKHQNSVKFVIAESIMDSPNQVSTFIKKHGGPGVQHIGLKTDDLVTTVNYLKKQDLPFLQPPSEYYNEVSKINEISDCGKSVEMLEKCGILLDSEECDTIDSTDNQLEDPMNRYLMQIFTKAVFGDGTFFLEFLQRHGAQGFGAGNIRALFRAVKLYMDTKGVK